MNRGRLTVSMKLLHEIMRLPDDCEIESINTKYQGEYAVFVLRGDGMPDDRYDMQDVQAITHVERMWTEIVTT